MRTIFLGSGIWGCRALEALVELRADVVGVFTFDPDPHESREHDVAELAGREGIPVNIAGKLDVQNHTGLLHNMAPDIGFVVGWRTIIPDAICDMPAKGFVGIHASLLPRYRGFAPINWAIIEGEQRTGVTLFHLSHVVDGGDIIGQRVIDISRQDTAGTIALRAGEEAAELVRRYYPLLREGRAPRRPQDDSHATYRPRRRPSDGLIDWNWPAERIYNWVRALTRPYPGAFSHLDGRKVTIWRAGVPGEQLASAELPGRITDVRNGGELVVATGGGTLLIEEFECDDAGPGSAGRRSFAGKQFALEGIAY
jgi:methionyl-tRNA formyltransferase